MTIRAIGLCALLVLQLSGCSVVPDSTESGSAGSADLRGARLVPVDANSVPAFSVASPGGALTLGWEPWIIHPAKRRTSYTIVRDDGRSVLRAEASSSASGLLAKVDVDPEERPVIGWSWKAQSLLADADVSDASREDSPLRLVVAFDGDKDTLPIKDRMFFERVKMFTGRDMPFATLMYVWENNKPVESVVHNPHSERVRKIVVASGADGLKRWLVFRRNLIDDYQRAFGHRPAKIVGIAVMTDSDNTRQDVAAYYGDITLSAK